MAKLGSLFVQLGLNTAEFDKDLGKASKRVRRVGRKMRRSFQKLDKQLLSTGKIIAGVAGPAALGLLVKNSFETVDALAKTADKLGLTTEALAGLRHAAEQTGIAQNTLDMALQRMTRRIAEAAQGTGEAKAAIKELGLDAKALAAAGPDKAFQMIAGAMEETTNKGDKLRLAFKLFDSEGAALVNTLALGTKGLEDMQKEAEILGLAVSRIDAAAIEETSNAFNRMKGVVKGAGNTIAVKLAPFLTDLADRFTKAAIESGGFKDEITTGINIAIKTIGFLADAMRMIEIGWKTINVAFQGFIAGAVTGVEMLAKGVDSLAKALGLESAINPEFLEFAEATRMVVSDTAKELEALTAQPMPSENIEQWKNDVVEKAAQASEAISGALSGGGGGPTGMTEAKKAELAKQVEALRKSTLTEQEILEEKYKLDLERLKLAEQNKIDSIIPYQELREKLEEQHQKKLGKIRKDQAEKDKAIMIRNMADGMQIVGQLLATAAAMNEVRNKKEFERSKKLQMASIVINTASAAMKAYNSAGNPYLGAALAAVVIAAGAAQLNKVSSTSYSGGGSVGGAPPTPATSSNAGNQPLADTGATTQQIETPQEQRIVVNLDGQPIIDTIQRASTDGRIEINASSVRAA